MLESHNDDAWRKSILKMKMKFRVLIGHFSANIYLFKVNKRNNTRKRHWRRSGVVIVNFELISHLFSIISIVKFE